MRYKHLPRLIVILLRHCFYKYIMNTQSTTNQEANFSSSNFKDIPLSEITSFMDRLATLYSQYKEISSVCNSLASHYEQEEGCKKKIQLLESIRIEAEAHLNTLKNNMFIEIRAIMRDYLKSEQ